MQEKKYKCATQERLKPLLPLDFKQKKGKEAYKKYLCRKFFNT